MKVLILIAALILPLWAAPFEVEQDPVASAVDVEKEAPVLLGIGALVGNSSFGASGRVWIKKSWGVSLNVFSDWKREVEGWEMQFDYKIPIPSTVKPYVLVGGGLQMVNLEDVSPVRYNQNLWTFSGGAGAEAIVGRSERHGISMELSYLYGELDYSGKTSTTIGDEEVTTPSMTKSVSGMNVKLLYHFYFKPGSNRDR